MSPTFDVVTLGESLGLLTAPQPGRLHHNPTLRLGFGGAESNVAIGVARLGGTAAWIGRLGADSLGELILRELRAEGVQPYPVFDLDTATALMVKERPHPGAARVTYYRRGQAGSRLRPADVPIAVVTDTKILHVTGISAGWVTPPDPRSTPQSTPRLRRAYRCRSTSTTAPPCGVTSGRQRRPTSNLPSGPTSCSPEKRRRSCSPEPIHRSGNSTLC